MNLPPHMRQKAQNTFLSGVVPAPDQPDMTTIMHLLTPLVDKLVELDREFVVRTPKHPRGRKVTVRLACLIGNIVATHKVAGFTSHSDTYFCSWCDCPKERQSEMIIWCLQKRRQILAAACHWKEFSTIKA